MDGNDHSRESHVCSSCQNIEFSKTWLDFTIHTPFTTSSAVVGSVAVDKFFHHHFYYPRTSIE
jgi:hypothetical protein